MDKSLTLAVIGGDERQVFLASLALADGHAVRTFALDRANIAGAAVCSDAASCTEGADAVLLPSPSCRAMACCAHRLRGRRLM